MEATLVVYFGFHAPAAETFFKGEQDFVVALLEVEVKGVKKPDGA